MRILIAEDEQATRMRLERNVEKMGYQPTVAENGAEAWELFQEGDFGLVLTDWMMPEMDGLELVRRIRASQRDAYTYVIMLTSKSETSEIVEGMEAGADDFVAKPFDRNELRARLNAGLRIVELEHNLAAANDRLRHELAVARELTNAEHRKHEESLLGDSIPVRALRDGIQRYAATDEFLLLTGPAGAGQEAVARAIHRASSRCDRPFIYVACDHLAGADESLFGCHAELADESRFGKASLADGGTLYLERVEALSQEAQTELARFFDDAASERSDEARRIPDVRVIVYQATQISTESRASVNPELERRLGMHRLAVPSLAERREDIAVIAESILDRRARSTGKAIDGFSEGAEEMLQGYAWPGNIRELQNVVERALVLASTARVDIPEELLREGRRVGGYTLERKLGAGAMGEVWLAKHSLLARPSAVKLIRQDALRGDASARGRLEERFRREARATAHLRSPHAVELYDFGVTDDGDFYYVMEYLSGIDLDSLVKKFDALPPARAVHLLRQVCMSLGEAHSAGLVHRDIKPANLFVCRLGPHYDFVKLLDFGIVRTTSDVNQTISPEGQISGTPMTLSPEVINGEQATPASDIYGLGCVAYWLLAGQHVFFSPGVMALLMKHTSEAPTPLSQLNPEIPSELDELVIRCLAKNPSERPADAFEIHRLLSQLQLNDRWDNQDARAWWNEHLSTLVDDDELHDDGLSNAQAETITMESGRTDY